MTGQLQDMFEVVVALRWVLVVLGFLLVGSWGALAVGDRNYFARENERLWRENLDLRTASTLRWPAPGRYLPQGREASRG